MTSGVSGEWDYSFPIPGTCVTGRLGRLPGDNGRAHWEYQYMNDETEEIIAAGDDLVVPLYVSPQTAVRMGFILFCE